MYSQSFANDQNCSKATCFRAGNHLGLVPHLTLVIYKSLTNCKRSHLALGVSAPVPQTSLLSRPKGAKSCSGKTRKRTKRAFSCTRGTKTKLTDVSTTRICPQPRVTKSDLRVTSYEKFAELQVERFTTSQPGENFCTASPDFSLTTGILELHQTVCCVIKEEKRGDRNTEWPAVTL